MSLPALCFHILGDKPQTLSTTLYSLLKHCEFVSFTADTIVQTIITNGYKVTAELLAPFMCCRTDCDMESFASVYLGAIYILNLNNHDASVQLAEIVLKNTTQVWRHGTYYRFAAKEYEDVISETKVANTRQYIKLIIRGIKKVFPILPPNISALISDISDRIRQETQGHTV